MLIYKITPTPTQFSLSQLKIEYPSKLYSRKSLSSVFNHDSVMAIMPNFSVAAKSSKSKNLLRMLRALK